MRCSKHVEDLENSRFSPSTWPKAVLFGGEDVVLFPGRLDLAKGDHRPYLPEALREHERAEVIKIIGSRNLWHSRKDSPLPPVRDGFVVPELSEDAIDIAENMLW